MSPTIQPNWVPALTTEWPVPARLPLAARKRKGSAPKRGRAAAAQLGLPEPTALRTAVLGPPAEADLVGSVAAVQVEVVLEEAEAAAAVADALPSATILRRRSPSLLVLEPFIW